MVINIDYAEDRLNLDMHCLLINIEKKRQFRTTEAQDKQVGSVKSDFRQK